MSVRDVFIKDVQVQNYKSLKNLSIRLHKGLNIIIGANGSGKTNFLNFIFQELFDVFNFPVTGNYFVNEEPEKSSIIDMCFIENEQEVIVKLERKSILGELKKQKRWISSALILSKFKEGKLLLDKLVFDSNPSLFQAEFLRISQYLEAHLIEFALPRSIPFISEPGEISISYSDEWIDFVAEPESHFLSSKKLHSSLFNGLPMLMAKVYPFDRNDLLLSKSILLEWFEKRKKENDYLTFLSQYSPVSDIRLSDSITPYNIDQKIILKYIALEFKVNGQWIPWSYLPDGASRIFYIITEVVFNRSKHILIEEPELGIHPHLLYKLLDFLQQQSENKQIIITTHSPLALDIVPPDQLDQIIIAKMTDDGTKMFHLTDEQKEKAIVYMEEVGDLSTYWLHSDLEA